MTSAPVFFQRNHHDKTQERIDDIHTFVTTYVPSRPHSSFTSKKEFVAWTSEKTTDHRFLILNEAESPTLRPGKLNPVRRCYGLIVDYDAPPTEGDVEKLYRLKAGRRPTYRTTTFSGNQRLVFLFEEPVVVGPPEMFLEFKDVLRGLLKLDTLLGGFDEGAYTNPGQHFEFGRDWVCMFGPDTRLDAAMVQNAMHVAAKKVKGLPDIVDLADLDVIAAEIERRWPDAWRGGPIEHGAVGNRFWDESAIREVGCQILTHGVMAYSGEQRFIPWDDPLLLGPDFFTQFKAERLHQATKGIYFDGHGYWSRNVRNQFHSMNKDVVQRALHVTSGLSRTSKKGAPSELDEALTYIETLNWIDGAFPFHHEARTLVEEKNGIFLNVSRAKLVQPLEGRRKWGEDFPWIADYICQILPDELQRSVMLAWLHRAYATALTGKPKRGHALFLAGPTSVGKTFFSKVIVGGLLGGHEDASDYILGKTEYNESLAYSPVWAIDDAVATADAHMHAMFTQKIKKFVANPDVCFHAKYQKATTMHFNGRLIVTMNIDAESIRMLPQLELSILDKILLLMASGASTVNFLVGEEQVAKELPAFASFLRDYKIPESMRTRPDETMRFGFDAYHHPELVQSANLESNTNTIREVLTMWRREYFNAQPDATEWIGTATELLSDLNRTDSLKGVLDPTWQRANALGRAVTKLTVQASGWVTTTTRGTEKVYVITKDDDGTRPYLLRRYKGDHHANNNNHSRALT